MATETDEKEPKATCRECGFSGHPDQFDGSPSAYHDLKCPKCETTNIDWTYGDYVDNTLQTTPTP